MLRSVESYFPNGVLEPGAVVFGFKDLAQVEEVMYPLLKRDGRVLYTPISPDHPDTLRSIQIGAFINQILSPRGRTNRLTNIAIQGVALEEKMVPWYILEDSYGASSFRVGARVEPTVQTTQGIFTIYTREINGDPILTGRKLTSNDIRAFEYRERVIALKSGNRFLLGY